MILFYYSCEWPAFDFGMNAKSFSIWSTWLLCVNWFPRVKCHKPCSLTFTFPCFSLTRHVLVWTTFNFIELNLILVRQLNPFGSMRNTLQFLPITTWAQCSLKETTGSWSSVSFSVWHIYIYIAYIYLYHCKVLLANKWMATWRQTHPRSTTWITF